MHRLGVRLDRGRIDDLPNTGGWLVLVYTHTGRWRVVSCCKYRKHADDAFSQANALDGGRLLAHYQRGQDPEILRLADF